VIKPLMLLLAQGTMIVFAAPLTITLSGTGSGTLNGKPFVQSTFTFTLTTDTNLIVKPPCCNSRDTPRGTPTSFSITGAGSGTLTDDQAVFAIGSDVVVGLAHFNGADMIDFVDPRLANYALTSSVGPLTGGPSFVGSCPGPDCTSFLTSAGLLNFSTVTTVTFNAVVGTPPITPSIASVGDQATQSTQLTPGMPVQVRGSGLGTGSADALTVTIAGKAAPILQYISESAVLVQVPADAPLGAAAVVATYKGNASAAFSVTLTAIAPKILPANSLFDAAGNPVTTANPAVPGGAYVAISAIGLGETIPPVATGTTVTELSPTKLPVQVMIGGKMVATGYAGLDLGTKGGYYRVTFKVSLEVPQGNQPLYLVIAGLSSNTITVPVGPAIPYINGALNGATFKAKGASANSFFSLFGFNFGVDDTPGNVFPATSYRGLSVLFDGVPAPLYNVFGSIGQINLVLPSELPESGTVSVQVKTALGTSAPFSLKMARSDVGMFRIGDPSKPSRNNGAVLLANTAWRVMPTTMAVALGFPSCTDVLVACGKPALEGDTVVIFLTGAGKATPDGDPSGAVLPTGSVAPVNGNPLYRTVQIPAVTIGGRAAQVLFSGIAPGNAGLYQINVVIPSGVTPGDDVPITVTTLDGSTDTVTIAVGQR
jgi:uncharacterized protein (TIGR03437 family)